MAVKKPFLSRENREEKVEVCPNYTTSGLIMVQYCVNFGLVWLFGSNSHRYAWRSGERYNSESLQSSAKHSRASDVQDLVKIDRIMNTEHM